MLQSLIITPVLLLTGWCIWTRRYTWRMRWHRALTLAITLEGAGFFLCMPIQGEWLGPAIFSVAGIAHLRDYFGHLCFLAALAAMIYVVASRLLPDRHIESFMRRIEITGAVAALSMLVCLMSSNSLRRPPCCSDFFQVPRDSWLSAYWVIASGICGYLLLYLVNLLFVLREDPRNRLIATLFITGASIRFVFIATLLTNTISAGRLSSIWIWVPLCISSGLFAFGAAWPSRGSLRAGRRAPLER